MTMPYLPTAGAEPEPMHNAVYTAQVANATDPLSQGRVRLIIPQLLGTAWSNWAVAMQPGIIPSVGTPCLALFLGGNINAPYYFIGVTQDVIAAITGNTTVLNTNPYYTGQLTMGWTAANGTLTAVVPNADTNPPLPSAVLYTAAGSGGGYIQETAMPFTAVVGQPYQVQAWVYYPAGGSVSFGFGWTGQPNTLTTATVPAGSWSLISAVETATSTSGWPMVGPVTTSAGSQLTATAITVTGQIPGQIISAGSISSGQVAFNARQIGGITTTIAAVAPTGATAGDLWFNSASGYQLYQYDGVTWNLYQFGTGAIQTGSVTAALIAANTITAAQIAANTITATQIAANTITTGQISVTAGITGSQIAGTTITGSNIVTGTITTTQIAANTIVAGNIAANSITTTQIAANTITTSDISLTAGITGGQIAGTTITGTNIATGTVTAAKLAAGIVVAGIINGTTLQGATIIDTGNGYFGYNGTPAAGNLIFTANNGGGTDAYGNVYLAGVTTYGEPVAGTWMACNLSATSSSAFGIIYYTASSYNVSWGSPDSWVRRSGNTAGQIELGPIVEMLETTVPVVPASGSKLWSQSDPAGAMFSVMDSDGNNYRSGPNTVVLVQNQTINSTGTVVIGSNGSNSPMQWNVNASTYLIQGMINWAQGPGSVAQQMGYTGPAIYGCRISNNWWLSTSFSNGPNTREAASLALQSTPAYANGDTIEWIFTGAICFSSSGNFQIVASANTGTNDFVIGAFSYVSLIPVSPGES